MIRCELCFVKLTLKTRNNITWWKSIKIYVDGNEVHEIWTQDDKHSASVIVPALHTLNYEIEFCKAAGLGVHTGIKRHSIDIYGFRGYELKFDWIKDW